MKSDMKEVDYKVLKISSEAFGDNEMIPPKYTCDGINVSPPLSIGHLPLQAKSLAIIADDPDAPAGTWVHWVAWNIPCTHHLEENKVHGTEGKNDFGINGYGGPCPPSGMHRYFFKIYALDTLLQLPANAGKTQLEKAMSNHIIAFGELTGLYARK